MSGETEAVEAVEKQQEAVLSQEVKTNVEAQVETPATKVVEKTPEEKRRDAEFYIRRQEHKSWRQREAAIKNSDFALQAAKEAAIEVGSDPNDETVGRNVQFMAKSQSKLAKLESDATQKVRMDAAHGLLAETFTDLGIDPNSEKAHTIATSVLKKYRYENPDLYSDKDLIQREADRIGQLFNPAPKANPVKDAILNKAGVTPPRTETRSQASGVSVSEVDEASARMGISKEKAQKIIELKKKNTGFLK